MLRLGGDDPTSVFGYVMGIARHIRRPPKHHVVEPLKFKLQAFAEEIQQFLNLLSDEPFSKD